MKWRWSIGGWIVATVVTYVLLTAMESVVYGVILVSQYAAHSEHWLPEPILRQRAWLMWIGYLVFAMLFSFVYTRGYQGGSGLGEGFRYGLWMGLLIHLPRTLLNYSTLPLGGVIMGTWGVSGIIETIILGIFVGLVYKPVGATHESPPT
ncbi:MAG: hypothetical protein ACP5JH_06745 [Bacteroidota bacterium]